MLFYYIGHMEKQDDNDDDHDRKRTTWEVINPSALLYFGANPFQVGVHVILLLEILVKFS